MTLSLRSALLTRHGFRHGFSLRHGGVSQPPFDSLNLARGVGDRPEHVAQNHLLFARDVGYDPERLFEVSQVHGARVEAVTGALAPHELRAREADALCCSAPLADAAIGVRVADCVAVLFAHPPSGAVAAAHAGWRGVVQGVLARAIEALARDVSRARGGAGFDPSELIAAVFPHIGVAAFEVGDDVAAQIAASAAEDAGVIDRAHEKPHADLARAVRAQLLRAGVAPANLESVPGCTFSQPERFFSYRRDGSRSGRHLAVIMAGC